MMTNRTAGKHTPLRILGGIAKYAVLIGVFILTIYPVFWMISGSLKDSGEFFRNIWGLPQNFVFENYAIAWEAAGIGTKYINSLLVTGGFLVITVPSICCAAYALARLRFKGRKTIYRYLLLGLMIPSGVLAIPVFTVLLNLGLINTKIGLLLAYSGLNTAFAMFIMRNFFISLPRSLEEAAYIDGCNKFQAFIHTILPLARPGVMVLIVYCGLNVWNEYLLASITLRNSNLTTLPVGLAVFVGRYNVDYPPLFAALVCTTLPIIILYCFAQRTFVEGMTAGAVKG